MSEYKVNGTKTHSGSLVFTSKDKAEIEINGVLFKLNFIENGKDTVMYADLTEDKHVFIFQNFFREKSTSTSINLPLENGGVTKIYFSFSIIGSGPLKSILLNYSYRNESV